MSEQNETARSTKERRYEPGQVVCLQGQEASHLFVLREGSVEVIYNDPEDLPHDATGLERGRRIMAIDQIGMTVGEMGVIQRERTASMRAGPEGAFLEAIPSSEDQLAAAIEARPSLGVNLARGMADRLRHCTDELRAVVEVHGTIDELTKDHGKEFYQLVGRTRSVFRGRRDVMVAIEHAEKSRSYLRAQQVREELRAVRATMRMRAMEAITMADRRPDSEDSRGGREVVAGEVLFERGDPAGEFHLLLEGKVQIELEDRELRTVETGGVVGVMGVLLNDSVREVTARTLTPCRLLTVERDRFGDVVEAKPGIAVRIFRTVTHQLKQVTEDLHQHRWLVGDLLEALRHLERDVERLSDEFGRLGAEILEGGLSEVVMELGRRKSAIVKDLEETEQIYDSISSEEA